MTWQAEKQGNLKMKIKPDDIKGFEVGMQIEKIDILLGFCDRWEFDSDEALRNIWNCKKILEELENVIKEEVDKKRKAVVK